MKSFLGSPGVVPTVTVIVPAFNEAAILADTLHTLIDYLEAQRAAFTGQILVVNDGSTDGTGAIAEEVAAEHPIVRVIHHRTNFRLGQALRFAFNQCDTDYLVTVDSDLSYDAEHIGRLVEHIHRTRAKIVLASPYAEGGVIGHVPPIRKWLSRWANRYLSVGAKGELSTLTGMVRAYDRRFLQSLDLSSTGIDINTEIIYKARILSARIEEIPATLSWTTIDRRSSSFSIGHGIKTYILSGFLFRPLLSLLLPAFFFFGVAVLMTGLLVQRSLSSGESLIHSFNNWPGAVLVGAVSLLLSLQFVTLALLAWQAKRNFENLFHIATTNLRATQELRRELTAQRDTDRGESDTTITLGGGGPPSSG